METGETVMVTADELLATVDCGNSRIKGALWRGNLCVERFCCGSADKGELLDWAGNCGASKGILCSVGVPDPEFDRLLKENFGVPLLFLDHGCGGPLEISYASPETLGMDRLAAAAGASSQFPETRLMVVDAGTAMTVDFVDGRSRFIGGSIAPGISMRLDSLARHASRLPDVAPAPEPLLVGTDTRSSLVAGCVGGALLEILSRAAFAPPELKPEHIFITGGDAPLLMDALSLSGLGPEPGCIFSPDLVETGLREILLWHIARKLI